MAGERETCRTCRFWAPGATLPENNTLVGDERGECRKRCPVGGGLEVFLNNDGEPKRAVAFHFPWPLTHTNDWCGEHAPREDDR